MEGTRAVPPLVREKKKWERELGRGEGEINDLGKRFPLANGGKKRDVEREGSPDGKIMGDLRQRPTVFIGDRGNRSETQEGEKV